MKIKIISVGKIKDHEIKSKINDYTERIKHDAAIELHTVKDSDKKTEGKKLIEQIKKNVFYTVALSEEGKEYTSKNLPAKYYKNTPIYCSSSEGLSAWTKQLRRKQTLYFPYQK